MNTAEELRSIKLSVDYPHLLQFSYSGTLTKIFGSSKLTTCPYHKKKGSNLLCPENDIIVLRLWGFIFWTLSFSVPEIQV
jgi:hypothetical protein